jgi:hypothetical protein
MRKIQVTAVMWTMFLAIPLTVLAASLAAFLTENMGDITAWLLTAGQLSTVGGRGWVAMFAERLPEIGGMIVGQAVIMTILIFVRRSKEDETAEVTE